MILYKSTPADFPIVDIQFVILPYQQGQTLQELYNLLVDFSEKMKLPTDRSTIGGNLITSIQGQINQFDWSTFEHLITYSNDTYNRKDNKDIYLNITGYFGDISDQNFEHLLKLL